MEKIGVFVAGGPAAGINGVIKGLVQEADNSSLRVLGFLAGAHGLVHGRFVQLTREMVEDIQVRGGSILGTSRFRITGDADVAKIVAHLREENVEGLVSIGGEGTLQLADRLRQAGVHIVHVPKTIDNDIEGVEQTFGFDTAVHVSARMLTAIKLDAQSSGLWFVVEIMGRFTGHLALEAGLASGCTRVLIPEAGHIDVDELAALVEARTKIGLNWGVILVAESAHFGEGHITRHGRLGGVSEVLADRLEVATAALGCTTKVRTSNLGYFLRCPEPTGFDRSYGAKLGLGAACFMQDPSRSGQMVTVVNDRFCGVPMESVAGKMKPVSLEGVRYQTLCSFARYESARADLEAQQLVRQRAGHTLQWLDAHATPDTIAEVAMRLGIGTDTLLEVLQDMAGSIQPVLDPSAPDAVDAPL